jgi:stage V sporulation protein B
MTNMLQALDKTKIPLISMSIGALVKLVSNFIFVSIPSLNVNGAVIGTVSCYAVITIINLFAIIKTTRIRINFISVFIKPIICGVLCGISAYTSFGLSNRFIPEFSLAGHDLKNILCLGVAIGFGGLVYVISTLFVKGLSKDDVNMLPKGEKIAKILAKYGFIE